MKLLFDHHLSPSLIGRLGDLFPGSEHVWNVNLHSVPGEAVWLYAREPDFTVVPKDADFSEISMQLGYPPKLIWLQIKNWSTDQVEIDVAPTGLEGWEPFLIYPRPTPLG